MSKNKDKKEVKSSRVYIYQRLVDKIPSIKVHEPL